MEQKRTCSMRGLGLGLYLAVAPWNAVPSTGQAQVFATFRDQGEDVVKGHPADDSNVPEAPALNLQLGRPPESASVPGSQDRDPNAVPPQQTPASPSTAPRDQGGPAGQLRSHYFLRHRAGNEPGMPLPYTTVGIFRPVPVNDGAVIGIAQFLLNNDGGGGGGFSLGRRWFQADRDRIVGIFTSYDLSDSRFGNLYQQMVFSGESRGELFDVFGNVYLPVGREAAMSDTGSFDNLRFQGEYLLADAMGVKESSMLGIDLVTATRLGSGNLWAMAGAYHFQGQGEQIYGATGGLRGYLTARTAMDVSVSDDHLFGTNVGFSGTFFFGGTSRGAVSPSNVFSRMNEPIVRRDSSIIRENRVAMNTLPLTHQGAPITFTHVDDGGIGSGTGTFEDPAGSLIDADSSTNNVVLVRADSVFVGQQFQLVPGQLLLGEGTGVVHLLYTDQLGATPLPRASFGSQLPILQASPGNSIVLASGTTVSGFDIRSPAGAAIFGGNAVGGNVVLGNISIDTGSIVLSGASADFEMLDLSIGNSNSAALDLSDLVGRIRIHDSVFFGGAADGVSLNNVSDLLLERSVFDGFGGAGLTALVGGANTSSLTLLDNRFLNTSNQTSFGFAANSGAVLNLRLLRNEDSTGFAIARDNQGLTRIAGSLGAGGAFADDNGNLANNGNTSGGLQPNVTIVGAGNLIEIDSLPPAAFSP